MGKEFEKKKFQWLSKLQRNTLKQCTVFWVYQRQKGESAEVWGVLDVVVSG